MDRSGERTVSAASASNKITEVPGTEKAKGSVGHAAVSEQTAAKKRFRREALAKRDGLTAKQRRDYSGRIIKKLISLPCYENADAILTYVSFRSEADTFPLLERAFADGKAVFVPKVLGKEMAFYQISSPEDLAEGYRGILEPSGGQSFDEWVIDRLGQSNKSLSEKSGEDRELGKGEEPGKGGLGVPSVLVCMPGAAFDRARHRIGYGGGFYDRYLSGLLQESASTDAVAQSQADADTAGHLQRKVTTAALAFGCQIFETIPWEAHDICPEHIITETEII